MSERRAFLGERAAGGARLDSTPAAKSAETTSSVSMRTVLRRRRAAGAPRSGSRFAASSRGLVIRRLTAPPSIATASNPLFTRIAFPYEVCQSDAIVGMWMIVAPMPLASRTITETNATFEKRGTATPSPATRLDLPRPHHRTSSPIRPPIQTEAETRWSQSSRSDSPRGAVCAAWPAAPGINSTAAAARIAPASAPSSAIERCSFAGRSSQTAIDAATQNRAKQISRST